jgi:lysophospholipase L1-like esterase
VRVAPVTYVALGDSTGIGLGARNGLGYVERLMARIQQTRPGSRLINLSTVGATTTDVLSNQLSRYPDASPSLITLSVGANDLMRGSDEQQFARDYEKLVLRLKELRTPVVLTNLPDISLAPGLPESMHKQMRDRVPLFNNRIEDIAKRHELQLVDLYGMSRDLIPSHPEFFSSDGIHPSDEGYKFWADKMWPAVSEAMGELE